MRIRKFEAATVQQAINRVKAELGDTAVILHTRTFPGRFFGLLGKPRVEVTAAVEEQQPLYEPLRAASKSVAPKATEAPPPTTEESLGIPSPAQAAAHEFLARMSQIRQSEREIHNASHATGSGTAPHTTPQGASTGVNGTHSSLDSSRFERLEVRFD